MVAAKLAKMPQGKRNDLEHSANLPEVSQPQAAAMLNVSERTLRTAKQIQEHGVPELVQAVNEGKASVSAAAVIAKQDQDTQCRLVAEDKLKRAAADLKKAEAEAKEVEKLPKDANQHTEISASSPTQEQAEAMPNVSVDSIQFARKVEEQGAPELVNAVEQGDVSVSAAIEIAHEIQWQMTGTRESGGAAY